MTFTEDHLSQQANATKLNKLKSMNHQSRRNPKEFLIVVAHQLSLKTNSKFLQTNKRIQIKQNALQNNYPAASHRLYFPTFSALHHRRKEINHTKICTQIRELIQNGAAAGRDGKYT